MRSRGTPPGAPQRDPPAGEASEEEPILSECEADEPLVSQEPGSGRGLKLEAESLVATDVGEEAKPPAPGQGELTANGVTRGDGTLRVNPETQGLDP